MNDYHIKLQEPDHNCTSWRWRVTLLGNTVGQGMADDDEEARALAESWLAAYQIDASDEGIAW